jgi:thioesterase domain-containing protein
LDPLGPYVLGGWSAGVPIALEMAQQLKQDGHDVPLVVAIDSVPANTGHGGHRLSLRYMWKVIRNVPRWASDDLAQNFSWSEFFQRTMRKCKGGIERVWIARRSEEEIRQRRARAFVKAGIYSESTNAFMQAFYLILAKYVPKPYSGPVVLYKARTEPLFKAREIDLRWKRIASDLEIVEVPGTHITVMDERNVECLAQDLDARLRKCRQRALSQAGNV